MTPKFSAGQTVVYFGLGYNYVPVRVIGAHYRASRGDYMYELCDRNGVILHDAEDNLQPWRMEQMRNWIRSVA